MAHNGNLTNAHVLRRTLVRRGCLFQSTTDSEVFIQLIAISLYSTVVDRLIDALKQIAREAVENPELVQTAPHSTRVRRMDETAAARKPVLRWKGPAENVLVDSAAKDW